jgi:hypothetical protein
MSPEVFTLEDALTAASLFVQVSEKPSIAQESVRMCCESALRVLCEAWDWNAMKKSIRVLLQPTVTGVNFTYAGTAGESTDYGVTTVDREIISDTAWPGYESPVTTTLDQAGISVLDGTLRLGNYSLNCIINSVTNATHAQLDSQFHPSADYTTAQAYMLGFPKYPLPPEFAAGIVAAERNAFFIGTYVTPQQWFLLDKYRTFTGIVRHFTFMPDPNRYGQQALYVHPCPQTATEYDLQIKAWRRPMRLSGKEEWNYQGTITTNSTTAVTGSGTAFDQRMVGAVLRVAGSGTKRPTGTAGANPYLFQQTIASVTDTTHLTLTAAAPYSLSGVGYSVSDPCDVPQSLWECYKAACEVELSRYVAPKEYAASIGRYQIALRLARAADNMNSSIMGVGSGVSTVSRLREHGFRPLLEG